MRKHVGALALVAVLLCAEAAIAQGPIPDSIASSTLTRAQQAELTNRLERLQQRFDALARETDLRAAAVRNVAIEIFGADPELEFDSYVGLIDRGARSLRDYLSSARARDEPDAEASAIRTRAIEAAEQGLLSEALALYDQLIAIRAANGSRTEAERAADATTLAESAALAWAQGDFIDSARRYGEAAALATGLWRWSYLQNQGGALFLHGQVSGDVAFMADAIAAYERALELAPRETAPTQWAVSQNAIAVALEFQARMGVEGARDRAIAVYQETLAGRDREADPSGWSQTMTNLGIALRARGARGDLAAAIAALEGALAARDRTNGPFLWAHTAYELAVCYRDAGRVSEARAMAESARDAYTQAGDSYWPGYVAAFIAALPAR